jgi:outer membrane lipoprotein SlyB
MKNTFYKYASLTTAVVFISGCTATGQEHRADVFKAGQTNRAQEAQIIRIMSVSPGQIEVDNSEAQKNAQLAGAIIGAFAGASAARNNNRVSAGSGAAAGVAVGTAAGSMVSNKAFVNGVMIGYMMGSKIYTSAQVGRECEFKAGSDALLISTGPGVTRVQPNATCPQKASQ